MTRKHIQPFKTIEKLQLVAGEEIEPACFLRYTKLHLKKVKRTSRLTVRNPENFLIKLVFLLRSSLHFSVLSTFIYVF